LKYGEGGDYMNGKLAAALGADNTVSEQYVSTVRRSERVEPEFSLLRAILEDAVHCYRKYQSAQNRTGRESFREVEAWIMSSHSDWIFSFENVCELLGLDPMFVRHKLRGREEDAATQRKSRQGTHRHGRMREKVGRAA
jgi:hypothetical protein